MTQILLSGVVAVILMVLLGPILVGLRSFSQFRNRQQEKEFFLAWGVFEKSWLLDFYPTLTLPLEVV
jgi:hypothetical protein